MFYCYLHFYKHRFILALQFYNYSLAIAVLTFIPIDYQIIFPCLCVLDIFILRCIALGNMNLLKHFFVVPRI